MFLSQSLQSPSFAEKPSPSWSVASWYAHVGSPLELPLELELLSPELELELLSPELVPLEPELDALPLLVPPELPEELPPSAPPTKSPDPEAPLHAARTSVTLAKVRRILMCDPVRGFRRTPRVARGMAYGEAKCKLPGSLANPAAS
jgi:hypothetical protein